MLLADRLKDLLEELRQVAEQINLRGWAEANAGNVSVNVSAEANQLFGQACQWFLVSRSGSRYRQLAHDPLPQLVLARMDGRHEDYCPADAIPTSEWSCHRLLQRHFLEQDSRDRVVLHAHPNSVILLSQMDLYRDESAVNALLKASLDELELFLPEGVATVPKAHPGSQELAELSLSALGNRKALIWQGHGLVCTGPSVNQALDIMEVVEKAATIALCKFNLTKSAT